MADLRTLRLPVLTSPWRAAASVLLGVAAVNLPFTLAAVVLMTDPPVTPGVLVRSLLVFSALPAAAGWSLLRLFRTALHARPGAIALERPGLDVTVPCRAVAEIEPWRLPLPRPGLAVRLRSGERLPYGICGDPLDALDVLAEAEIDVAGARTHPTVVYARERARRARFGWRRLLLKFVVFGVVPTAILFNAHQHIAYGGTFGQYYLYGPSAYFETLAIYWLLTVLHLVLFASLWRGLAEVGALSAAWIAPASAGPARQAAEVACAALYYGGVPLLLLYRFLS